MYCDQSESRCDKPYRINSASCNQGSNDATELPIGESATTFRLIQDESGTLSKHWPGCAEVAVSKTGVSLLELSRQFCNCFSC